MAKEYGMDPEDLDEEELAMLAEEDEDDEDDEEEEKPKKKKKSLKKKHPVAKKKVRFAAFSNPARTGVIDVESNEPVAEGDMAIFVLLANILERLERIEKKIGDITDE